MPGARTGRRSRRGMRSFTAGGATHAHASGGDATHVNVTPMIDVVMCLIVFFLLVGHLAVEKRGGVRLPDAAHGSRPDARARPLIIAAPDSARVLLEGRPIGTGELASALRAALAEEPGRPVQLRAGRDVPYFAVQPLINACREAGVPSVQVAAADLP